MKLEARNRHHAGWSRKATLDDGTVFQVRVTRGRRLGKVFGNTAFEWRAEVFDLTTKDRVWTGRVHKGVSDRAILKDAGVGVEGAS